MEARRIGGATRWITRAGTAVCLGLILLLAACSSPEDAAALEALAQPDKGRFTNDHYVAGPYDCGLHEGAGDVVFMDEWVESGHWIDFVDGAGAVTRSMVTVNAVGAFTDVASGNQLTYQQSLTVSYDYATDTQVIMGLWLRLRDVNGKVVGHNVGRWVSGPEGFHGAGQLDVGLVCPYFPQSW